MALPPGFLDELRSRVSIAQIVGRSVTWDLRKSNQGKGDFWAPCPFHHEKSASFHVDDRKGYYYCFGCQAKGDVVTFLRESQNMGFMEAVEALAREAGMPMPAPDPRARARDEARTTLAEVMEKAVRFYRMQLMGAGALEARAYLDRRGMSEAQRERWEIGFAPDQRHVLFRHLRQAGVDEAQIVEAGLCARPDGGGEPYDRFRGRILFPIRDARGRCIAFGGRALAEGAWAKYLNSPETPLFHKGHALFNIGPARTATGKGQPLIVAEGYMDVIALVGAGFEGAVAPLGTAVTQEQLHLMWRLHDEPVIALDGDAAGLRAGLRVADLALPLIGAGKGLRFALLPGGQDPDDLIKAGGPAAMQGVLDRAVPMAKLLWEREVSGHVFDSPERRAGLDLRLRELLAKIQDPGLRAHYADAFRTLRRGLFNPGEGGGRQGGFTPGFGGGSGAGFGGARGRKGMPAAPVAPTRASALVAGPDSADEEFREARILLALFAHPRLIVEFDDLLWRLDPAREDHRALQSVLLAAAPDDPAPDVAVLAARAGDDLAALRRAREAGFAPLLRAEAGTAFLRECLREDFDVLLARRALRRELAELTAELEDLPGEHLTYRLGESAAALERARRRSMNESSTDLGEDRESLSNQLQTLIDSQVWVKKKHRPGPS